MQGKNMTLTVRLLIELNKSIQSSAHNIDNTSNEAKTYWVGYNQALQDIRNRFYPEYSLPIDETTLQISK